MWLIHHRVTVRGEYRRPNPREAGDHFKIPSTTINNWMKAYCESFLLTMRTTATPLCHGTVAISSPRRHCALVETMEPLKYGIDGDGDGEIPSRRRYTRNVA